MALQSLLPYSWSDNGAAEFWTRSVRGSAAGNDCLFASVGPAGWPEGMSLRLETDKDISIDADLPSIDEKDFEVTVSGDRFMFHGERRNNCETKNKDEHLSKRSWAESTRQVLLPFEADPEKVSARLDKGVLHAIPKTVTMTAYVALLADTAK